MKKKILLVGGAGYIGTVLTKHLLLNNFQVVCLDNLIYSQKKCLNQFLDNPNFQFIHADIRDGNSLKKHFKDIYSVVLLAGLVGDPISKKYPNITTDINVKGVLNVIETCEKEQIERLVFISTCSNYGITDSNIKAEENHKLKPLSLYASTKVEIEKHLMNLKKNSCVKPTILRFATAFGLSPRMRFDLTVNEFTKAIVMEKELIIYDAHTWRPYCHTKDFALLIHKVIIADLNMVGFEIFNVGDNENNYTKQMIIDEILKFYPKGKVKYLDKGVDPRNYIVDFSKVNSVLKFKPKYSIKKGIEEIITEIKKNTFNFQEKNQFGNYFINL